MKLTYGWLILLPVTAALLLFTVIAALAPLTCPWLTPAVTGAWAVLLLWCIREAFDV